MKTVRIPCPNCNAAGKVTAYGSDGRVELVGCPECKGDTTVEVLAPSVETFQTPPATMEPNTKPTAWQIVMAIIMAINSLAVAYTAFQSNSNHNKVQEIHQTQEQNAATIADVHKQVEAIHKEQLPRIASMKQ